MKGMWFDAQGYHLLVGDLDALLVSIGIKLTGDGEASLGGGAGDQLDDGQVADQRLGAPVHGDEGEQLVLDAVPFTGAGWQMVYGDGDPEFVGQHLQFPLPQAHTVGVVAWITAGDAPPHPSSSSGDAGGNRASQLRHAIQDVDGDTNFCASAFVLVEAQPIADYLLISTDRGLDTTSLRIA